MKITIETDVLTMEISQEGSNENFLQNIQNVLNGLLGDDKPKKEKKNTVVAVSNGHNSQIARIAKTSRHYVCQVLTNPEGHNGKVAQLIKETAKTFERQVAEMKEAVQVLQNQ